MNATIDRKKQASGWWRIEKRKGQFYAVYHNSATYRELGPFATKAEANVASWEGLPVFVQGLPKIIRS